MAPAAETSRRGRVRAAEPSTDLLSHFVLRAARILLQNRGGEALSYAAGKAADFAFRGDPQGVLTWKRILEAIRELQRGEGEAVH